MRATPTSDVTTNNEPIWQRQTKQVPVTSSPNDSAALTKRVGVFPEMPPLARSGIAMGQRSLSLKNPESRGSHVLKNPETRSQVLKSPESLAKVLQSNSESRIQVASVKKTGVSSAAEMTSEGENLNINNSSNSSGEGGICMNGTLGQLGDLSDLEADECDYLADEDDDADVFLLTSRGKAKETHL